jgi:hypothetical protein
MSLLIQVRFLMAGGGRRCYSHFRHAESTGAGLPRTSQIAHALYCADRGYWAVRASDLRFPSPEATAATPASIISALR